MSPQIVMLIIAIVAVIAVVLWAISTSNRFKMLEVKISEADSGIDVALTKRYDTLSKLVDVVKGYTKHESELFEKVIKLRAGMSMAEKSQANHTMDEAARKISLVAENYPELRSNENYLKLQDAIIDVEDHLQAARRVYNMNVSTFNQSIVVFPASIIAGMSKKTAKAFFEADESKRPDFTISL